MKHAKEELTDLMSFRDFYEKTGIHITTSHSGKMKYMYSLSTNALMNPRCVARCNVVGTVCHDGPCYACGLVKIRKGLADKLAQNTSVMTYKVIPVNEWPLILSRKIFRLEAFGDVQNVIQAINYINFCRRNPHVKFGLFTKNPDILHAAYRIHGGKPSNLIVDYGSPYVNIVNDKVLQLFPGEIDHIFTVVNEDGADRIGGASAINCGARDCYTCGRCYRSDGDLLVFEAVKNKAKKILSQ